MDLRLATACVLAIAAGCSPGEKKSTRATEVPVPPTNVREAERSPAADREEPAAVESLRPAERLCDAFDRAAVAKAMGWRDLERVGSDACSSDQHICSCLFMAKDHSAGAGFGVMFIRSSELMRAHLDAPYAARAAIAGHDAVVAKHSNGKFVTIQVKAYGITIETNANDAGPPDEVEAKLADATAKLLATLAIDPAAALRE